ncbi:usherin [Elysia marginata]|uniref:Usherin n=1 Tax=Elysia marginata TaxID=1093978 RepID=A0AAV4H410_9GAST|nr:usherin [Elysia marginata]
MLSEPCMEAMLDHVTLLLQVENLWTASNAALVLARLCISEEGCNCILKHSHSHNILTRLILALGVDEAGRGMNAAFAIGRLCDMDTGRQRLLSLPDSEKMITSLAKMLSCEDTGASKNACFALSCLATNNEGHGRLLGNSHAEEVLKTLSQLLSAEDSETGWFAAMTLRTLASQPRGCLRLREFPQVHTALKKIEAQADVNPDLKEEVVITLEILKRLEPPDPPCVTVLGPYSCHASWTQVTTKSGFEVRYQLFEGSKCFYTGTACQCEISHLSPHTVYHFKVRAVTDGDESAFSEASTATTEEDLPESPQNMRILGATISQLKVGWDPPENFNGVSKGYYVYHGKTMIEHTMELSAIISGLSANTVYEIQVCAATSKGKGLRASVSGTTAELGAHAPSKPHVQVLGRNEVHVSWEPPEVPMGRITRYDVSMNGKIIYSGTDLSVGARRLTPDTEYTFIVTALTNEGKFESKATKKRTSKDEFDPDRPPLYQTPKKEEEPQKSASQKKRKSVGELKSSRSNSAKGSHCGTDRPGSAGSALSAHRSYANTPRLEKGDESLTTSPLQKARTLGRTLPHSDTKKENVRPRTHKESPSPSASSATSRPTPSASGTRDSNNNKRQHHQAKAMDKPSGASKPWFPVTVSYVSIQGGDDQNLELDAIGPDFSSINKKTFLRSPTFLENSNSTGSGSTLRVERSKTSLMPPGRHARSPHTLNNNANLEQQKAKLGKPPEVHAERHQARDISLSSWGTTPTNVPPPSQNSTPDFKSTPLLGTASNFSSNGKSQTQWLPKPTIPNSDYLDGNRGLGTTLDASLLRSFNSPRASFDQERDGFGDIETFEAHLLSRFKRNSEGTNIVSTVSRSPVDSYYFESQQAFLHRALTFVNSHRPGLKKPPGPASASTPGGMVHVLGSASLSLPENRLITQRAHNKFVPMQLRTQPNNLTAGQLQRMNTTLSENGRGGLPGRRLEALTRSQTQMSFKSSQHNQSHSQLHAANRSAPNHHHHHQGAVAAQADVMGIHTHGLINGILSFSTISTGLFLVKL